MEHAVDAEPDAQVVLGRLDVNVGSAVLRRLRDEHVDELDDRRVLDDIGDVPEIGVVVLFVRGRLHDRVDIAVDAEEVLDRLHDLRGRGDDHLHFGFRHRLDVVDREDVRRVGHRDDELAVFPRDRDRLVSPRDRLCDERRDRGVDDAVRQVDELEPDLVRERTDELGLGDDALLDQQAPEGLARLVLLGRSRVELCFGEETFGNEKVTQRVRVTVRQRKPPRPPDFALSAGLGNGCSAHLHSRSRARW